MRVWVSKADTGKSCWPLCPSCPLVNGPRITKTKESFYSWHFNLGEQFRRVWLTSGNQTDLGFVLLRLITIISGTMTLQTYILYKLRCAP